MTAREARFSASGLAFIMGIERFDEVMPMPRVVKLLRACNEHYGWYWINKHFVKYIIHVAEREENMPGCSDSCNYRIKYATTPPQRNALRVEITTPLDRCGANLKYGRIGGRADDYHPCTFCQD